MAATMLLNCTYNPAIYNSLGQIEEVHKLVAKEQIQGLGNKIYSFLC